MSKSIGTIKISDVRENPVALRTVDRESEAFIGLRDSIADKGILNPVNVRTREETVEGKIIKYYELIDGLHRYTAALDVGLEVLDVKFLELDDVAALEAQIMANVHKIDTKPVEYTKQMTRIFTSNPIMTVADMAGKLCKSPSWVSQRLGLLKLVDVVAELVDDGKITISNAIVLSKLPHVEQVNFVDGAMSESAEEFAPKVLARAKELRDAERQGRVPGEIVFAPVARQQKLGVLREELDNPSIGPALIAQNKVKDAVSGFALGVAWACNLDPASVEVQRAKAEEKAKTLAEAKKKRAADRAKKKAEEAAVASAKAQEALSTK